MISFTRRFLLLSMLLSMATGSYADSLYRYYSKVEASAVPTGAGSVYVAVVESASSAYVQGSSNVATQNKSNYEDEEPAPHYYCLTAKNNAGYTFSGWYTTSSGGTKTSSTAQYIEGFNNNDVNSTEENPTTHYRYARFSPISYTISYTLNGGTATNPTSYNITTSTFTLNNPTRSGYKFLGWTGSNGSTPQTSVSIAKGSTGNKSYTATWSTQASVTAAPTSKDLTYTGSEQALVNAVTASGGTMQYSLDGSSWSISIPTGTNAGDYTVYYKVVGDASHHDNPGSSVSVTITQAPLTITADDKSITYGDAAPAYTASYSGFVGSETTDMLTSPVVLACTYNEGDAASEYTITANGATAANYNITFVNGTLTVNKAALTVTADDKSVTFGDAAPAYTATITGFVGGEDESVLGGTLNLACAYTNITVVGTYDITPSGLTATNYIISYNNGTLTVNAPAGLALYDNADPTTQLEGLNGSTLDVTLNRSVIAGCYNTICLPFDVTAEALADPSHPLYGYTNLKAFDGADVTGTGQNLFINIYVRDVDHMEAGIPYLISYPSEQGNIVNPFFSDVTFSATTPSGETHDGVTFQGMFGPVHITTYEENTTEDYLFLGANNRLMWPNDDGTSMRGYRAYFIIQRNYVPVSLAPRGTAARFVARPKTPTDIESVQHSEIRSQKVLENGRLYIISNGVKYDAQGKKLR